MNDPISDALTRIKNGYLASKPEVVLTYSNFIKAVCEVLKKAGYITDYKEIKTGKNSTLTEILVTMKYENRKPVLSQVQRVSKPGLRVYKGKKSIPYVLNGLGIAIISTPRGVMTDKQARKEGLGGEVVAFVW
jgi:small subunit ribosomal protein S8